MKQVLQSFRSGALEVKDVPTSVIRAGGVLVANCASLISAGTERQSIDLAQKSLVGKAKERPDLVRQVLQKVQRDGLANTYHAVKGRLEAPLALGYSCAGLVQAVGRGAEAFRVGDRVACAGMNYASHAEVVFVPKNLTVKIPDAVTFDEAAFATLGAIALQGVRTAEVRLGETVAVIGLGLLGQLTVQILKAAGCHVIGVDLDQEKVDLAKTHGADFALRRANDVEEAVHHYTGGYGADAIIITAAAETNDPIELAGALARDRAVVVMVGAVGMNVPRKIYYEKELQLRLSRSYGPGRYDQQYEEQGVDYPIGYVRWTEGRNLEEFLRLVATRSVSLEKLITHRFTINDASEAYNLITGVSRAPFLGVLLTYPTTAPVPSFLQLRTRSTRALKRTSLRLGLIGAGNFAKSILLPQLSKMSDLYLTGIATSTGRTARAVGEQFGFEFCTGDYRELLARRDIDAVLIATRHDTHAQLAAEALWSGKAVFLEKPLALDCTGLTHVADAVEQNSGQLMVGFNRRFSTLATKLKQAFAGPSKRAFPLSISYRVNAGAIPQESWIQREEGGGRILGEVCHFVDFLQFLTDADPLEVFAYGCTESKDTLSVVLRFSDGSVANINYFANGDRAFPKERVEVYGGGGVALLDDFRSLEVWQYGKLSRTKLLSQDKGFQAELSQFVSAALHGSEMPIEWPSLALTTLTTIRITDSLRSGKPEAVIFS